MTQAFTETIGQSNSDSLSPSIADDKSSNSVLRFVRNLHGIILASSFMVLFPAGALMIHNGNFKNVFTYHWTLQLALTVICWLTVVMSFKLSEDGAQVSLDSD
jgi:hypothetical protein